MHITFYCFPVGLSSPLIVTFLSLINYFDSNTSMLIFFWVLQIIVNSTQHICIWGISLNKSSLQVYYEGKVDEGH